MKLPVLLPYRSATYPTFSVDLNYCGYGHNSLTVGGMRVELTWQRDREISQIDERRTSERDRLISMRDKEMPIAIYGGGPHVPEENRLVELESKAHTIQDFFGQGKPIELRSCSIAMYFHDELDNYRNFLMGTITRATPRPTPVTSYPAEEGLTYNFGSASANRRVRLSCWREDTPLPSGGVAFTGLDKSSQYQEGREIIRVELAFKEPFIRRVAQGIEAEYSEPTLPPLLRELVRTTLGDETLPSSFFRVADIESRYLEDSLRPNSATWENVRRTFLAAVGA